MDILRVALAVGGLVFVAALLTLHGIFKGRMDLGERLNRKAVKESAEGGGEAMVKRLAQVFKPLGAMFPGSTADMSRTEKRLAQAGFRRKDAAIFFRSAQVAMAICLAVGFSGAGYMYQQPVLCLILSLFGGAALPDMWLKSRAAKRKINILHGLPDALDLAVVAVEAGLGLDQALMWVGNEIRVAYPELSDELQLRNLEVNMGKSRSEALRNLAERTDTDDLKALAAILIQTDKFGTSVCQALRTFSESLRIKRRQGAEEQAAKLAIKMVVPMVLFIFPAIFVVILGPPFIGIMRDLLPALAGR